MDRTILYVNACVQKESRTKYLAEKLLSKLDEPYEELRLEEIEFPKVDAGFLALRDRLLAAGDVQNPLFDLARQFSEAETVVIAAPYWDLSFPAALKAYLEQINVVGLTFRYTPEGVPEGLCRAKRLWYVTTAGGDFCPEQFGFGYVEALAQNYYGIADVRLIRAAGLDLRGANVEKLLLEAEAEIRRRVQAEA